MALGAVSMQTLPDEARLLAPACICLMALALFPARQNRALRVAFVFALAAGACETVLSQHSLTSVRETTRTLQCTQLEAQGEASFTCLASDRQVYLVHSAIDVVAGRCIAGRGRVEPFDGPRNP